MMQDLSLLCPFRTGVTSIQTHKRGPEVANAKSGWVEGGVVCTGPGAGAVSTDGGGGRERMCLFATVWFLNRCKM